jgi:serine protease Do
LLAGIAAFTGGVVVTAAFLRVTPTARAGRTTAMLSDTINSVLPGVVNITAETGGTAGTQTEIRLCGTVPPPVASETPKLRDGSGFIIDPAGYILTNRHVVESADDITVTLQDGTSLHAKVMGVSPCDLAVLKIDAEKPLPALEFGDSDALRVGQQVVAVGNPLGIGTSVSVGVVSALHRDIRAGPFDNFIQTDAAINHGNSGGPLLNMSGKVVGINTAIISPTNASIGLGFAFPSKDAKFVADQLRKDGRVHMGWVGLMVQRVTPEIAQALSLPKAAGAIVTAVMDPEPGRGAFQLGDVITQFDGKPVQDHRDFVLTVGMVPIGRKGSVGVWRDGAQITVPVTVTEWSDSKEASAQRAAANPMMATMHMEPPNFGWKIEDITDEARGKYDIAPTVAGALVAEVMPGGAAAESELAAGDVIENVQRVPVASAGAVQTQLDNLKRQNRPYALLLVQKGSGLRWATLRLFPMSL